MLRFLKSAAALCVALVFVAVTPALAAGPWKLRNTGQPSVSAPILNATNIPFGGWTQFGKGVVRLSSPGLGLVASNGGSAITGWNVTTQATGAGCGNSAHWTAAGAVAEGASAITPTSSVAGDTAHLVSGNCNFNVTATNATGTSAPVVVSMIVNPNAASIGDNVQNYPGGTFSQPYSVAGFEAGTTAGQRAILITPGIDRGTSGIGFNSDFTFTDWVTLKDADPARPSQLDKIQLTSGSYWDLYGLTFSSPTRASESGGRVYAQGTNHLRIRNVTAGTGINSFVPNLKGAFLDSVTNLEVTNFSVYGQHGGFYIGGSACNITVTNLKVRWYSERGLQIGSICNATFTDYTIMSPRRIPGSIVHIDAVQIEDMATYSNLTLIRGMLLTADVYNSTYQGVFNGTGNDTTTIFSAGPLMVDGLFSSNGAPTAWGAPAANVGTSYLKNATFVKLNTGVYTDCITPEGNGACPMSAGASVGTTTTAPARYAGTFAYSHVMTDDTVAITPGIGVSKDALTVKEANHGSLTNYFADATARTTLEAIPFNTWFAMDFDTVVATYKAAYKAKLNGDMKNADSSYSGAWDVNGNWNTN